MRRPAGPSERPLRRGMGRTSCAHGSWNGPDAPQETGSLRGGAGCGGDSDLQPPHWVSFDEDGRCRIGDDLRVHVREQVKTTRRGGCRRAPAGPSPRALCSPTAPGTPSPTQMPPCPRRTQHPRPDPSQPHSAPVPGPVSLRGPLQPSLPSRRVSRPGPSHATAGLQDQGPGTCPVWADSHCAQDPRPLPAL